MFGLLWNGRCAVKLTPGLQKIKGVKQMSTLVALISSCILVSTQWACAFHETVGQKGLVCFAVGLNRCSLLQVTVLMQLGEDVLCNLRLLVSGRSAEDVEANVEPLINLGVNLVVLGAQLFWCAFLFYGLCLGRSAVLIGTADK